VFLSAKTAKTSKKPCRQTRIIAVKREKTAILRTRAQYRNSTKYYIFTPKIKYFLLTRAVFRDKIYFIPIENKQTYELHTYKYN